MTQGLGWWLLLVYCFFLSRLTMYYQERASLPPCNVWDLTWMIRSCIWTGGQDTWVALVVELVARRRKLYNWILWWSISILAVPRNFGVAPLSAFRPLGILYLTEETGWVRLIQNGRRNTTHSKKLTVDSRARIWDLVTFIGLYGNVWTRNSEDFCFS